MALPDPAPDTTVLVTGASSGIGTALARSLAARGYGLTLTARRRERLEDLAADLVDDHGIEVDVVVGDIGSDRARSRLIRHVEGGRTLVGVCNNAGTGAIGLVLDHTVEQEAEVFRTNALALHDLTNRLVRPMVERGAGAILNTASILAFAPIPQNATYAATKAFIASYSEALHTELQGTGVSCTVVNPGPTRTQVFARSGAAGTVNLGPDLFWQDASQVAEPAVEAMIAGRRSVIPGLTNRLAVLALDRTPRTALLPLMRVAQSAPVRKALLGDEQTGNDDQ